MYGRGGRRGRRKRDFFSAGGFGKRWQNAFLLLLIAEKPGHGYDLAHRLEDFGCMKENTGQMGALYRMLSVMEEEGYITADWITSEPGPARKMYKITDLGKSKLHELRKNLDTLKETIDKYQQRVSELED